jgi:hypothetical protein
MAMAVSLRHVVGNRGAQGGDRRRIVSQSVGNPPDHRDTLMERADDAMR